MNEPNRHQQRLGAALLGLAIPLALAGEARAARPQAGSGSIRWFVDLQSPSSGRWTAVAPDGTIYATNATTLFAVNPNGSVKWTLPGAGAGENIDLGADGTIYTGGPGTIPADELVAVHPGGTLLWSVSFPENLVAGPSVGPDGNVYGAVNQLQSVYGAFSFDPAGQLRWTSTGNPPIKSSNDDWPVEFVGGRAVMGVITSASQGSVIWAFLLGGSQDWFGSNLPHNVFGKPVAHPAGFILTRSHASGMEATLPDGSLLWQSSAPKQGFNGIPPVVHPDGTIYADGSFGDLWAVNPDGSTRFYRSFNGGGNLCMGIPPDGSLILVGGSFIGSTGYVQAFDPADGAFLWQVDVPQQNGTNVFAFSARFTFSSDSRTAYFTTRVGAAAGNGRLYAIDLGSDGPSVYCTAKVNSAGCTPSIGSTGTPSASAGSGFLISTVNELANRPGIYFYSKSGPDSAPFQGGFLCAQPPLSRTRVQGSGGTPPCGGQYSLDFNAYIAGGADPALTAGQQVWLQTWSRDPASPSTTNLSDALAFTIGP